MIARLRHFGSDESGVMIVMTLLFLTLMMMMGGMAVDFMRFESRRVMLQSVSDRAVLAAADINQRDTDGNISVNEADPKEIVLDYFKKAGFEGMIVGEPDIINTADFRSVGVKAQYDMNTIYLRLLGIKDLAAPAAATAVEGVANIEVSLVVDISGSMRDPVTPEEGASSSQTKIQALRAAATTFAESILTEQYKDKISLSFVPYSEHVNIGPALMANLPVDQVHNFSYCMEFDDADFNTAAIDMTKTYAQMQHYQYNSSVEDNAYQNQVTNTVCPRYDYEQVVALTQNLASLKLEIAKLTPRAGTSIFLGLKWGLALLDPSMKTPLVGVADAAFSSRPAPYPVDGEATDTQKVIVLMTDGQNDSSQRLQDYLYNSESAYAHWDANNLWYYYSRDNGWANISNWYYTKYTNPIGNTYMQQLCTLAKKKGVIIYTVAVEATTDGKTEMANCASSNAHYFNASGDQLEDIFESIAKQITELRLSL